MTKKEFIKFLKDEGAYDRYVRNLKEAALFEFVLDRELSEIFELVEMIGDTPLAFSFHWKNTPEGHDFWNELDTKYVQQFNFYGND